MDTLVYSDMSNSAVEINAPDIIAKNDNSINKTPNMIRNTGYSINNASNIMAVELIVIEIEILSRGI